MATLSALTWVGNAAAVLSGEHGAVSRQAAQAGCSRQAAYRHAPKVLHAVEDARLQGPSRAELLDDNRRLRAELDRARSQGRGLIDFGPDRRHCFAATAAAMGLSLNQTADLLAVVLPEGRAPDRSTVGRWVEDAARRAGPALEALDERCRPLTRVLCPDEIFFHGTAVLVACEPHSLAVLVGRRAADRTGATWEQALRPFGRLEAVVCDAGTGLAAGVALLDAARLKRGLGPLEAGLDLFHTEREAQTLLAQEWRCVERAWARAERADHDLAAARRAGRDLRGPAARARSAWRWAFLEFGCYDRREAAWKRARAAFELFGPDGRLADRAGAEARLRAACRELAGDAWRKVRGLLEDPRALTFLDRMQRLLVEAEPRREVREAVAQLWRLERGPGRAEAGPAGLVAAVQRVVCAQLAEDWAEAYRRVSAVLGGVVRASSCVECVNSVLRMHQGRHRMVPQPLLDLKRLYWNTRAFRSGKRRDKCPYQHLGLELPTFDFWELLHKDPATLSQEMSTAKDAA